MSLAKPPSVHPKPEDSIGVVDITSRPIRRVEVDTERLSSTRIVSHGEGYKWTVDYYQSLTGMDNTIEDFDSFIENPSQQYNRIIGMLLKVSTPIRPTQDGEDNTFTVTGEAFIDSGIKPNIGNVFIASVSKAQNVLFSITNVEMLSASKRASYRIEYTGKMIITDVIEEALQAKVIETFYYSPENLERTGESLITASVYNKAISIDNHIDMLKELYLRKFYDNRSRSITVPISGKAIHDPQVASCMRHLGLLDIVEYNHPPFEVRLLESLYTFVLNPSFDKLRFCAKNFGQLTAKSFYGRRTYNNIYFSNYEYTIWSGDYEMHGLYRKYEPVLQYPKDLTYTPILDEGDVPYFNPVTLAPYVLSEGFYHGIPTSHIEVVLLQYIKGEEVNVDLAIMLYDILLTIPDIDFFYYTPLVLLVLMYVKL